MKYRFKTDQGIECLTQAEADEMAGSASGEFVRAAYTKRKDDDDWTQAGALVREVMDDAARDRLVSNVVGHLSDGVTKPVLERVFQYWHNIDEDICARIARAMNKG